MKFISLVVTVSLSVACQAQVHMKVLQNNKPIGNLVVTEKVSRMGTTVELTMDLKGPSGEVTIRRLSTFDRTGQPFRKVMEMLLVKQKKRQQVVANFGVSGVNVVMDISGRRVVKDYPLVAGASAKDPSEFWFRPVAPKVGTSVTCISFDLDRQEWVALNTLYSGKVKVVIAGVQRDLHRVVARQGDHVVETLLDDKGDPVRIVDGLIRLEREN